MSELTRAASRLNKGRDFNTLLDAKLAELNELLLSYDPVMEEDLAIATLIQYHALREFGEFVATKAEEVENG